jgi:hypothetical protein
VAVIAEECHQKGHGAEEGFGTEEGQNESRVIKLGNEEVHIHIFHVIFLK